MSMDTFAACLIVLLLLFVILTFLFIKDNRSLKNDKATITSELTESLWANTRLETKVWELKNDLKVSAWIIKDMWESIDCLERELYLSKKRKYYHDTTANKLRIELKALKAELSKYKR